MSLFSNLFPQLFKFLLIAVFLPFLVACGGSSSGGGSTPTSKDPIKDIINPLKISNLTADSVSQITLSWSDVAGASYYEIYQSTQNTTTSLTAISTQTRTTFKSKDLTPNTTYYYWGKICKKEGSVGSEGSSINTAGHSCTAFSTVSSKTTLIPPPDVPTTLTLSADSTSQITVSWTTSNEATSYKLYRNISDSNTNLTVIATLTSTSYKDAGLMNDTTYYYWVKGCKENLEGVQSCSDFSQVTSKATFIVPPNVPSNLSLTANSTSQLTVSWDSVSGTEYYEIYSNISDSNTSLTAIATTKTTSYKDTGLIANTTYYYWVKACKENLDGEKACSDFSQVTSKTTLILPPDVPTTLTLSADSTSQLTVSWDSVSGTEYYEIYRNKSNSNTSLTAIATPSTDAAYVNTDLEPNTTYYYWVKACKENLDGEKACSDFSQVASKTTWVVIPSVPTGVSLTAYSASQITVRWDSLTGADYYDIYRHTSNSTAGLTAIDRPSTDATTYVNTGLNENTRYYYWIKACNENTSGERCSNFSQVASTATWSVDSEAPPRITTPTLTVISTSQMTVLWTGNNEAKSYEIYRNTKNDVAGLIAITTLTAIATTTNISYTDTDLTADTTYYYWVKACKKSTTGKKACSNFSAVTSKATLVVIPSIPTILDLTANSASQITVSWTDNEAHSYEIYRNRSDSNTTLTEAIATTINTSYKDTGLTDDTLYYYWVKACNENTSKKRCSDFSTVASKTTLILPPDVPTTPTLSANSTSQLTVSWVSVNGTEYYEIYRNISDSNTSLIAIATQTNTSYEDTGLTVDTTYYYWVKGCKENLDGVKSCSDFSPVSSKATLVVIPSIPTILDLTANSASQITVSWTDNEAHSYEIYRNRSDSNTTLTEAIATTINTSYKDTGLTADTLYYYWVKACNENTSKKRCSDFSQVASKTTLIPPPDVPTTLTLSADSTSQITVSWTTSNEATSYELYRNISDSNTNLTAIATQTNTSYEDTGLTVDTTYYYWVKACKENLDGVQSCSDFSAVESKATLLNAPQGLSLSVNSVSQITVSWDSVTAAEYYEIYRNTSNTNTTLTAIFSPFASSGTTHIDSGLFSHTKYYYWLKACKTGDACSAFSEMASTKTHIIIRQLNDTGITWGGNYPEGNQSGTSCTPKVFVGGVPTDFAEDAEQDCHQGRDALAEKGTLTKIGRGGNAGFDFTKLGSTGTVLAFQTQDWSNSGSESAGTKWSCVKDNHTGLIWEVKSSVGTSSNTANIHHKDNTYRWGGKTALGREHPNREDAYYDDWNTLVDGSNSSNSGNGLCGFTDWRVPARDELRSIVDYGRVDPAIDTHYFPNTMSNSFWTSSPRAELPVNDVAWYIYFGWGFDKSIEPAGRAPNHSVRLVRGDKNS
jgi:titin